MKTRNNYLIYLLLPAIMALAAGCGEKEIMKFDPSYASVQFAGSTSTYSFKTSGLDEDIVHVPVNIVGYPAPADRMVTAKVIADSTTATAAHFELLDGNVAGASRSGSVKVKVTNGLKAGADDVRVYLRITANEDFEMAPAEYCDYSLWLTNKLLRPTSWGGATGTTGTVRTRLGEYSTAYYLFVIEVTGETQFPYPNAIAGYNDGKAWTSANLYAVRDKVREELKKRNEREGSPLLHDDGPGKGQEVVVGKTNYVPLKENR